MTLARRALLNAVASTLIPLVATSLAQVEAAAGGRWRTSDAGAEQEWPISLGVQNYVFGFPLTIFE